MKVVIMAAGRSTRAVPLTLTRPKPLLPIANRTILEHQLDALHGLVDGAVLVVGYLQEMIRNHMGDSYRGIHIDYVVQEEQLGTGHALLQCKDLIDGPFIPDGTFRIHENGRIWGTGDTLAEAFESAKHNIDW